jgi:hypothetical protein
MKDDKKKKSRAYKRAVKMKDRPSTDTKTKGSKKTIKVSPYKKTI